ncbi:MAG: 2-oxoglutarate dehydrogenase E1 subunit family protein, partial [Pseudonocardiaceae bacterium]
MYEQFLADPSAVDPAWHDFFVDYRQASRRKANGDASAREPDRRADTPAGGTGPASTRAEGPSAAGDGRRKDAPATRGGSEGVSERGTRPHREKAADRADTGVARQRAPRQPAPAPPQPAPAQQQ